MKKIASTYAIVLTGTPLENRLEELVSIVQCVDQHRLGPTFRFLHDHQALDEFGKVVGYRDLDRIGQTLAPVLLRRRKEDVLHQLPARLEKRFFHGGVESVRRRDLIDRFREDPRCRAFLSTDAGSVGLNLQHATVVVNVDLPWNPAVLEQRIGRVHRLGQTQPVQVVSFVAKGTIEEGMLSVLGFKRSLSAGVLDGGEREVFLGGSRLKRFVENVENVTAGIRAPLVEEEAEPAPAEPAAAAAPSASLPPAVEPLSSLLRTGLDLITQFATAAGTGQAVAEAAPSRLFERIRDERSGQSYLKIRMPEPEVMDRVTHALRALLESLRP